MPDGAPPAPPRTIRDAAGLVAAGLAAPADRAALEAVGARYAVAVTPAMQALIEAPDDPIGRQFLPDPAELLLAPHERADPIGDDALSPVKGIVHRYPDRALLKPLLVCPVYCRFCFRREHVGPDGGVLTASVGIACVVATPSGSPQRLMEAADAALYAAKQAGRNGVHVDARVPRVVAVPPL